MAKRSILDDERRPKFRDQPPQKDQIHSRPDEPGREGPSREVVFKVIHWHKATRAARDSAAYMGRLRPQDRPEDQEKVYNSADVALDRAALAAELQNWNLLPDDKNLSTEARKATKAERREMTEEQRLGKRQTMHGTLSFPRDGALTTDQIRDVAAETFRREFADKGHRYIYAVHEEGEKVHVHVLVKVEGRDPKARLRLGPSELRDIRKRAAEVANERYKTNYRATRREDRARTRDDVRKGRDQLRPNRGYREATGRGPRRSWVQEKAPTWYGRHGADYERRRAGIEGRPVPPPFSARLPALSTKANEALKAHFARYDNPEQARQKFLEMAAESREYAFWAANKKPETFGPVKENQAPGKPLTQARAPISRKWQIEARHRLADADMQEFQKAPERVEARRQAAENAKAAADLQQAEKRQQHAEGVFSRRFGADAPEPTGGGQSIQPDRDAAEGDGKKSWRERLGEWLRVKKTTTADDAGGGQSIQPDRDATEGDGKKKPTAKEIEARAAELDTRDHDGREREDERAPRMQREREDEAPDQK